MRVYFEKPRTATGWKGYINDPHMDDSFHIEDGMEKARQFLLAGQRTRVCRPPPRHSIRSHRNTWAT